MLPAVACGDDGGGTGTSEGSSSTTDAGSTSTSTSTTTDGSTGSMETGTTEPVDAECGDGIVEGPEPCDDNNPIEGDACNSDCTEGPGRWLRTYETAGLVSQAVDVAIDGEGNVFAVGSVIREKTGEDIFIYKYAPDGEQLWGVVSDAEGGEDLPLGIAGISDQEVVIASLTNTFFLRLDRITPDGQGLGNFSDSTMTAASVALGPSGEIVATGSALNSQAAVVTRAYDSEGALLWQAEYAGETEGTQGGTAVDVDANGNVYVGAEVGVIAMGLNTMVASYDSSGTERWVHEPAVHEDSLPGRITSVAVGPDNDVWVVAETSDGSTQVDDVLFRYGPGGAKRWQAPLDNYSLGVGVGADGAAVVVGANSGDGFSITEPTYRSRKFDGDGNELWAREMSAEFFMAGRGVSVGADGAYAVALDGIDEFNNPALAIFALFEP